MLRRMTDMPVGTVGFEAAGDVDDDDWEAVVEPVLRSEIGDGRKVRLLYAFGPAAGDIDDDLLKAGAGFRARHAGAFERVAVVSDESWVKPALRALSFLVPGRTRAFSVRDLGEAKAWLTEGIDPASTSA